MAEILPLESAFESALELLAAGQVVILPTETVYGLAADATNGEAVARIFETKGRPHFNPLIAHVSSLEMAQSLAEFDDVSLELAKHFWPGPLTLILPLKAGHNVHPLATAGLETVALRHPQGFSSELIEALGRPVSMPSANSSGKITATTALAANNDLGTKVKLIVDGGQTPVGVESTIVKVDEQGVRILRPGGVTAEQIEAVIGDAVLRGGVAGIEAPGMLLSHYAPNARVRLNAETVNSDEALLAFGSETISGAEQAVSVLNLSPSGNLREAAANLYQHLQALDRSSASCIVVAPVPMDGLGEAINDRLQRAAAPREN